MVYKIYAKTNETPKSPLARLYATLFFLLLTITIFSIADTPYIIEKEKELFLNSKNIELDYILKIEDINENTSNNKELDSSNNFMGYIHINDLKKIFLENIKYDEKQNEIIFISDKKVVKIDVNTNIAEVNGVEKKYTYDVKITNSNSVYIPFEILKDIYNFDIYTTKENIAIFYNDNSKNKVILKEDAYLKANETLVSGTINKIYKDKEYIFIDETKDNIKLMTNNVEFGYVNKKYVKEIIRNDNNDNEKNNENVKEINIITGYDTYRTNYKEITNSNNNSSYNLIKLFKYNKKSTLDELYQLENPEFKKYLEHLDNNNILKLGNIETTLNNTELKNKMDTYIGRKEIIEDILIKVDKYNLNGVNINFEDLSNKVRISTFLLELKARLHSKDKILVFTNNNLQIDNLEKLVDKVIESR